MRLKRKKFLIVILYRQKSYQLIGVGALDGLIETQCWRYASNSPGLRSELTPDSSDQLEEGMSEDDEHYEEHDYLSEQEDDEEILDSQEEESTQVAEGKKEEEATLNDSTKGADKNPLLLLTTVAYFDFM